jgi:hypothetical protein
MISQSGTGQILLCPFKQLYLQLERDHIFKNQGIHSFQTSPLLPSSVTSSTNAPTLVRLLVDLG